MKFKTFLERIEPKLMYHDELNPSLWDNDVLKPIVADRLKKIAGLFIDTLELSPEAQVADIIFTGSNANYNWTRYSDIDVHVIIKGCVECKLDSESCLRAKKTVWNDHHDIEIYGQEVEVYATATEEPVVAGSGSYSLRTDAWLVKPQRNAPVYNQTLLQGKLDELAHEIDTAVNGSADQDTIEVLNDKLWRLRSAGLQTAGEFSLENLVWKALRNNGYIDKLRKYAATVQDQSLTLEARPS